MKKFILFLFIALMSSNLLKAQILNATISSSTNVSCFGGNNGSATVSATGGTSPYTFLWNTIPQQTTATAINLPAGTYTVTVTDAATTSTGVNVVINQPNAMSAFANSANATCFGVNNGSIIISGATGGNGTYEYSINGGTLWQANGTFSGLAAGTYNVMMRDLSNPSCVVVINNSITISQPAQITANAGTDQTICHNQSATLNGSVTVATGAAWTTSGTGSFSPNSTSLNAVYNPSAGDLSAGTVSLTLTTTGNGACSAVGDMMILTLNPLPTITNTTPGTRCGVGSVTLGAAASAGNIMWYNQNTGGTSLGIGGSYTTTTLSTTTTFYVDATFAGCTSASRTAVVATINYLPVATATPASETICSGGTTNIILSSSAGGTSYSWTVIQSNSSGASSGSGTAISQMLIVPGTIAGTATYTITPIAAGCIGNNLNVTVTVNPTPDVVASPASQTICSGATTNIALSSNVAGTTFNWTVVLNGVNGGSNSSGININEMLSNVGNFPGTATYTVTPTANSCVGNSETVSITVNPTPNVVSSPQSQTICSGLTANIALSSSVSGTTFSWTVVQSGVTGSSAGSGNTISQILTNTNTTGTVTYTITPTANSCSGSPINTIITVNPLPTITSVTKTDVTLCGGTDGTITIVATGDAPLSYSFDNGVTLYTNGGSFTGFFAGNYSIVVVSSLGCWQYGSILPILDGGAPPAPTAGTNATYCQGQSISNLSATAGNGGVLTWYADPSLTNLIGTGATLTPFSTVGIQNYYITETVGGCESPSTVVTVTINPLPSVSAGADQNVCNGTSVVLNGSGTATTYSWDNGVIDGAAFIPVETYNYIVTGTDANGCTGVDDVIVYVNFLPSVNAGADQTICSAGNDGITSAAVSGGTVPYTYLWSNGATTLNISNLPTGNYTLVVTDANGCTESDAVVIIINPLPSVSAGADQNVCSGTSVILNGSGSGTGTTYLWTPATGLSSSVISNPIATPAATTTYILIVSDANGCTGSDSVLISVNSLPAVSFSGLATEFCRADTMVLLIGNYSTTGIFNGSGIIGSNVFNPLNATTGINQITYSYTDNNGCSNSYTASTLINEIPVLSATTSNATCNQNNGSAILSATGGTAPYQYSTGGNTLNNLSAGAYSVTVTDYNGCKSTSPIIIVNDGAPTISILSQVDAGCSISCDGTATIDITGGAEPYTINWSNGTALQNPTNLCVGENYVQVTDFNNCITGTVVNIGFSQPDPTIYGNITYSGGAIDGQFANLEIYSLSQNFGGGFDLMNSQVQVGSDGSFVMANFPPDMYILKVLLQGNNPAYANLMNSYYTASGTSYMWETADTIILNCGEYKEANIIMNEMLQTGTGSGFVSGTISYPGSGGSKNLNKGISISQGKLAGEPVPGAEIFIELEPDDEPIANTTTDTAGFYAFEELPEGGYSLRVEIPGFPMLSTYAVTVSPTDSVFEGLNFFVDTTVNDGNIDTSFVFIANEDAPALSVSVYPNPYTDFVTVAYRINKTREISINVYDITGKIIASEKPKKKEKGEYSYTLNSLNNLLSGAYFIQLKVDNNIYLKKVIKTK